MKAKFLTGLILGFFVLAPAGYLRADTSKDALVATLRAQVAMLQEQLVAMLQMQLATLQKQLTFTLAAQDQVTVVPAPQPTTAQLPVNPVPPPTTRYQMNAQLPPSTFAPVTLVGLIAESVVPPLSNTTAWQLVATFRFSATYDAYKLTDLYLMNAPHDALTADASADARIARLALIDATGIVKGTAVPVGGHIHFALGRELNASGLGAVLVPFNGSSALTVAIMQNPITRGRDTGKLVRLVIDSASGGAVAESTSNGRVPTTMNLQTGDIPVIALRKSRLSIASVPQAGSEQSMNFAGNELLYRFTVTNDTNNDAAWKGVKFTVSGSFGGAALSTVTGSIPLRTTHDAGDGFGVVSSTANVSHFSLFTNNGNEVAAGNYNVTLDWDPVRNNGEVAVVLASGFEEQVPAGMTKTYELRGRLVGATNAGDAVTVTLRPEANDKRTDAYLVAGTSPDGVDGTSDGIVAMTAHGATTPYSFLWSDLSGTPHRADDSWSDVDSADWTNDRFLTINTPSWTKTLR